MYIFSPSLVCTKAVIWQDSEDEKPVICCEFFFFQNCLFLRKTCIAVCAYLLYKDWTGAVCNQHVKLC